MIVNNLLSSRGRYGNACANFVSECGVNRENNIKISFIYYCFALLYIALRNVRDEKYDLFKGTIDSKNKGEAAEVSRVDLCGL